jgi:hypothetical protein
MITADPGYFGIMGSGYGTAVDMRSESGDYPSDQSDETRGFGLETRKKDSVLIRKTRYKFIPRDEEERLYIVSTKYREES